MQETKGRCIFAVQNKGITPQNNKNYKTMTKEFLNEVKAFYQSVKAESEKSFNWAGIIDEYARKTIQGVEVHICFNRRYVAPIGDHTIPPYCHIDFMYSENEEQNAELTPAKLQEINAYCKA